MVIKQKGTRIRQKIWQPQYLSMKSLGWLWWQLGPRDLVISIAPILDDPIHASALKDISEHQVSSTIDRFLSCSCSRLSNWYHSQIKFCFSFSVTPFTIRRHHTSRLWYITRYQALEKPLIIFLCDSISHLNWE